MATTMTIDINSLVAAAGAGDCAAVQAHLDAGIDVNMEDSNGRLPLEKAVMNNRTQTVLLLLAAGADVNGVDEHGTALHSAAIRRNAEMCELLLQHGAQVDLVTDRLFGPTALGITAKWGGKCLPVVHVLLAHGASPTRALHAAAEKGQVDVIGVLLQAGAEVDARDYEGRTPLFLASYAGNKQAVNALLAAGADPAQCGCIGKLAAEATQRVKQLKQELELWQAMPLDLQEAVVKLANHARSGSSNAAP